MADARGVIPGATGNAPSSVEWLALAGFEHSSLLELNFFEQAFDLFVFF